MYKELFSKIKEDLDKKQDEWVTETLKKNGINIPENPTGADMFFMTDLYKVEFEKDSSGITISIGDKVIGMWIAAYEDGEIKVKSYSKTL